ncbi:cyclic nucleotide-binding protein [Bacteroidia bacterium]|nr:cyclic nucleotide-binding protein [Bacteroidia bacterium]
MIARKMGLKYAQVSNGAIDMLASILICKEVSKNQLLLRGGEICDRLYYVDAGLVRQFYYKQGRDITEHFACEDDLCLNAESYLLRKPTTLMIEALEPTVVYGIPYEPLRSLMDSNKEINRMYRLMLESILMQTYLRLDSFRLESASERYQRFLKESPGIVRRVPLLHIASYLLMSPETLSRVRAKL